MKMHLNKKNISVLATVAVFILVYLAGAILYQDRNFLSLRLFMNLFYDWSFVGVAAVGMTFVIISGGIDLSVAGVMALSNIMCAQMITTANIHPLIAFFIALSFGAIIGFSMGSLIHFFDLPPFLVTLVGLWFSRGLAFLISLDSIPIDNPLITTLSQFFIPLGGGARLTVTAMIFIIVGLVGIFFIHLTRFGRNTYAVGGSEESAMLMGIPVGRTKIMIYTLSGFLAALAGITYTLYLSSGYAGAVDGLELTIIAAVVMGGTLLVGGIGYMEGTIIGVLILGLIQAFIDFSGKLNIWWAKIVLGIFLLFFILLQTYVVSRFDKSR